MVPYYSSQQVKSLDKPIALQDGMSIYAINCSIERFFMAKIDLKDAYFKVPIAAKFHCLLAFQDKQREFLQFQTLPYTATLNLPP